MLVALYPAVWGLGQLVTGGLSDRIGRKPFIAGGMLVQAVAIGWIAATSGFVPWALGALVLGVGTAMVYPTLLAAIGDVAHPRWRASVRRHLPALARRRLRGRRDPRRCHRRRLRDPDRDLERRRPHRRVRPRRRSSACTKPIPAERHVDTGPTTLDRPVVDYDAES